MDDLLWRLRTVLFGVKPRELAAGATRSILFVTTHCPTRAHAGGLRLLDLAAEIRALAPYVIIDVFTHRDEAQDGDYADVERLFDHVYYTPTMRLDFRQFRRLNPSCLSYDVVSFEYLQRPSTVASYLRQAGKTLFTPMELLTRAYVLGAAPSDSKEVRRRKRELRRERQISRIVSEVVCVARPDAECAIRAFPWAKVALLETGVSQIEFPAKTALLPEREPFTVLFLAYFGSLTNREALSWYLDGVHPLLRERFPQYRLEVVGRGDLTEFRRHDDPSLSLIGEVQTVGPYIARAAVGIAPAVSGAGFRGKINQYAHFSTPTVASPLALAGLAYRDGWDILVASSQHGFAEAIGALLNDGARRVEFGRRAFTTCASHYGWASKRGDIARIFGLNRPQGPDP